MKYRIWNKNYNSFDNYYKLLTAKGYLKDYFPNGLDLREGYNVYYDISKSSMKNYVVNYSSGLKDIHENEIFDGDIVKIISLIPNDINENKTATVSFKYGAFCLEYQNDIFLLYNKNFQYEIIGNIFQGIFSEEKLKKEIMKNLKVNKFFEYENKKLKVIKSDNYINCAKCYFSNIRCSDLQREKLIPNCDAKIRNDEISVYFEEIKE